MKKKNKVIPTAPHEKTKKQLQAESNLLNDSHRDLSKSIF
jgi:Zn-dependent M28 family amino/carboxypeptidase